MSHVSHTLSGKNYLGLVTYVKGHLSPGPDDIITEFLKDTTCTERKVILHWINGVITGKDPDIRLSVKEVHGRVALLHKDGDSTDRVSDYHPVVLPYNLFQLISCIIQERLVRIVEGSNILEPGQGGFRTRREYDINTRETQNTTSKGFIFKIIIIILLHPKKKRRDPGE